MSLHEKLIKLLPKLGYPDRAGYCNGFALPWIEACLADEEYVFHQRIQDIESLLDSGADIAQLVADTQAKRGRSLGQDDLNLLDMMAFFDSLELYQAPDLHPELFNSPPAVYQHHIERISTIASSEKINALGGLLTLYSESTILTMMEICHYLNELGELLQSIAKNQSMVFGIHINTMEHTIAIRYRPGIGWAFMEINQYPAFYYRQGDKDATARMAELIIRYFGYGSGTPAMNISIISTAYQARLLTAAATQFQRFKDGRVLTQELAMRSHNGVNLVFIAAAHNEADLIVKLARLGANLNQTNYRGSTPAYAAAYLGHVEALIALVQQHADLNQADNDGLTPAYVAAYNGHAQIIKELARQSVEINKANNKGITPMAIAIINDHYKVLEQFLRNGFALTNTVTLSVRHLAQLIGRLSPAHLSKVLKYANTYADKKAQTITMSYSELANLVDGQTSQFLSKEAINTRAALLKRPKPYANRFFKYPQACEEPEAASDKIISLIL